MEGTFTITNQTIHKEFKFQSEDYNAQGNCDLTGENNVRQFSVSVYSTGAYIGSFNGNLQGDNIRTTYSPQNDDYLEIMREIKTEILTELTK